MQVIRFLDIDGVERLGVETRPGVAALLGGSLEEGFHPSCGEALIDRQLAPLAPRVLLGIGLNYRKHAEETGAKLPEFPVVFFKNPSSVQHPGGPIVLPRALPTAEVDYEGELAVVIGQPCRNASRSNALEFVAGYTIANDVSARDWQIRRSGHQWCRAKSFDTFCPLGPALVTRDEVPNPNDLRLQTWVNDVLVQDSTTADMIFKVEELIEFLSADTTLLPGTVILTGTPSGVGMARDPQLWLKAGDVVRIEIEALGTLWNPVQ